MPYRANDDWWAGDNTIDTLRLSLDEYAAIVGQLGGGRVDARQAESRKHPRKSLYRRRCLLRLEGVQGTRPPYVVLPNNVSSGGASLLHGFFLQTGMPCDVAIEALDRSMLTVSGTVVRCRHIGRRIHEIGLAFDRRIRLDALIADYVASVAEEEDEEDTERFDGTVLYVDHNVEDRDLFEYFAGELGVRVETCDNVGEAAGMARLTPYDAVLAKLDLPGGGAGGLAEKLRQDDFQGTIAAIACEATSDASDMQTQQEQAVEQGCNAVLGMPLSRERLVDFFGGVLPRDYSADDELEPIYSRYWPKRQMRPLIIKFVTILDSRVRELERLLAAHEADAFRKACQQLTATSESYGYPQLARQLAELDAFVMQEVPQDKLRQQFSQLARICAAARLVRR